MKNKIAVPRPGEVVVLTFKGHPKGALGVHNGKTWFVWRVTNAGMTGEPNNWHPCEDVLIRAWATIPTGFLGSTSLKLSPQGRHEQLVVRNTKYPWKPALDPLTQARLDHLARMRQPVVKKKKAGLRP